MDQIIRTPDQLGAALRRQRKQRNLTQSDLGERIRKRQATVSNLEAEGTGTLDTFFAVLSALGLEIILRPRSKGTSAQIEDAF